MDKSKSEKLKEILNQKLSNEEIGKKLKEEADLINQKKDIKEQTDTQKIREEVKKLEEKIEKEEIKEPKKEEKKEKVVIPSVRGKEIENKESNLLLYLVSIIAILLLALTIYLFTSDTKLIKESSSNEKKEISKEIIEETQKTEPEIKSVLNNEISKVLIETNEDETVQKEEEIKKEKLLSVVKDTNTEQIKQVQEPKKIEIKEEVKTVQKEVITKIVKLDKNNFKKYYNSAKFNSLKCYNFKAGDVFPNAKCKKDLKVFLEKNKNAIRFEVIPVIAQDDNKIFDKIKSNISGMEQEFQDRIKEYMFRGLGRERVLETSWQIKDYLGENTVLTPTNYYVKSKMNNKGIIVKAYH